MRVCAHNDGPCCLGALAEAPQERRQRRLRLALHAADKEKVICNSVHSSLGGDASSGICGEVRRVNEEK